MPQDWRKDLVDVPEFRSGQPYELRGAAGRAERAITAARQGSLTGEPEPEFMHLPVSQWKYLGKQGLLYALTSLGGPLGRMAGAEFAPAIPGPVAAGTGMGVGNIAGELATGATPKQALKSGFYTALLGTGAEGTLNVAARTAGRAASLPEGAVSGTLDRNPIAAMRVSRFPEWAQGPPPRSAAKGLATAMQERIAAEKPGGTIPLRGMPEAEAAMAARPEEVDAGPIKQAIAARFRKPIGTPTPPSQRFGGQVPGTQPNRLAISGEDSANRALQDLLNRTPDKFRNVAELHDWIKRIRQPITAAFGQETPSLAKEDLKAIQAAAGDYRDSLLGGPESEGAKGFAQASERLGQLKRAGKILNDPSGGLRIGAEARVKSVLTNQETMDRLRAIDPDLGKQIEDLAISRAWTRPQSRAFTLTRMGARPVAKTLAVLSRPAGQAFGLLGAYRNQQETNP